MFSIIVPGRPCITNLVTVSPNQFAFSFPSLPHFSHVVIFILPGNVLPPETAAAVYMQLPGESQFKLLGAIGNEKQSAIFKVNLPASKQNASFLSGDISLGISVESASTIQAQLVTLHSDDSNSTALVKRPLSTAVLAQRIIKNAFNFLASFAGTVGPGGVEVVPLKSFQDWWTKFERKVQNDPGFLERDDAD